MESYNLCLQVSGQANPSKFPISAEELSSCRDEKKLNLLGGVVGVAEKLSTTFSGGISAADAASVAERRRAFGANKFGGARIFWGLVLDSLMTYMMLGVYAFLLIFIGIVTDGWPDGAVHGFLTLVSLLFSAVAAATVDYKCSLLNSEIGNGRLVVQVTRNGVRERVFRVDLLVGDIVHLSIGDQVPADGLLVPGSSDSRGSECPFLRHGTMLEVGPCTMMVTAVGARVLAGKLEEGGESGEEATWHMRVNRVAVVIGQICLFSDVVMFGILATGFFRSKFGEGNQWSWNGDDTMELLEIFALAITGKSKSGKHELKGFVRSQVCNYAFFPN